jgi:hypothetical protein
MGSAWSLEGWYFGRGETLLGPVTTGELKRLVADGRLGLTDTVWLGWKAPADRWLSPALVQDALRQAAAKTSGIVPAP